jgi:2-C-methyl-D-erythritol 4-phosphate cytidylyltransferase
VRRIAVVIPAGGTGRAWAACTSRSSSCPAPLLARSIRPFLDRPDVEWIVIALPGPRRWRRPTGCSERSARRPWRVAPSARDSVRNALAAVPIEAEIILVHDAARPLVCRCHRAVHRRRGRRPLRDRCSAGR